jgi:hypothetical protein
VAKLNKELSHFGLVVIGAHVQKGTNEEIQAKARSRGVSFAVVSSASVKDGHDFKGIPHAMVFDHTGRCVFRGSPDGAEAAARKAVGQALTADLGKTQFSKPVTPLVDALKKGLAPEAVLKKAVPVQRSPDAAAASEAKQLVATLTKAGQKQIEEAEALKEEDPYAAYLKVQPVPAAFRGTPVETKANALLAELKRNKVVAAELQAQPGLDKVKRWDAVLGPQAAKADPKGPVFQRAYGPTLRQMQTTLNQMKRSWPDAKATAEALEIGEKYGVVPR